MMNMLSTLTDKTENMKEEIDNVSRKMEIQTKNQKGMLDIKHHNRN